jgi:DNA-binding winged helix-turn-helix (wHTH) protein
MDRDESAGTVDFAGVFARFRFRRGTGENPGDLYRLDQNGRELPIRLGKPALRILRRLLRGPEGRWVSNKELKDEGWPGNEDGDLDDNLRVEIGRLRASLSENAQNSCVRWGRRSGYRYVEPGAPPIDAEQRISSLLTERGGSLIPQSEPSGSICPQWWNPHKMWSPGELAQGLRLRALVKNDDGVRFSEGLINGICEFADNWLPPPDLEPGDEASHCHLMGMAHGLTKMGEIFEEDLYEEDLAEFIVCAQTKLFYYLYGIARDIGVILTDGDDYKVDEDFIKGVVSEIRARWFEIDNPAEVFPLVLSVYASIVEAYIILKQPSCGQFKNVIAMLMTKLLDTRKLVDYMVDYLQNRVGR